MKSIFKTLSLFALSIVFTVLMLGCAKEDDQRVKVTKMNDTVIKEVKSEDYVIEDKTLNKIGGFTSDLKVLSLELSEFSKLMQEVEAIFKRAKIEFRESEVEING